jgi:prepilin-type N-terminal cleavage/methylation domain-containing protein
MKRAFSLVEVLAAVALIGILVFLALPNIVQVKSDSETHLAVARAEALNLAIASYVQSVGSTTASSSWPSASGATADQARYVIVSPYLAYAPPNLTDYMPAGYTATIPTSVVPLSKVELSKSGTSIGY